MPSLTQIVDDLVICLTCGTRVACPCARLATLERQLTRYVTTRRPPATTVTYAVWNTHRYLIDGQHTLTALGRHTHPIWLTVTEYRVATYAEVGYLYQTFGREKPRTWKDLYHADPDLAALPLSATAQRDLGSAATWLLYGFTRTFGQQAQRQLDALTRDPRVRLTLMADWHAEMTTWVHGVHGPTSVTKLLRRAALLAALLVTYRFQPAAAQAFWPRLARDSGLTEGDPAHSLLRWLLETPARALAPEAYSRYVATAWNAAFTEHSLTTRQLAVLTRKASQPFLLAGTPHQGQHNLHYVTMQGEIQRVLLPLLEEEEQEEADD